MPRRKTHIQLGMLAGAAVAYLTTEGVDRNTRIWAVLAGACGGVIGGLAPDWCDLPTSPNHRSIAHSGLLTVLLAQKSHTYCKESWATFPKPTLGAAPQPLGGDAQFDLLSKCFTTGAVAGYGSHLLADLGTPRGLPFL